MGRLLTITIVVATIVSACGNDDLGTGGSSSGGVAGDACIDYTSCGSGLYCSVLADAVEGKCETLPAACSSKTDCACLGDALSAQCGGKGSCSARIGRAMFSCPLATRKKQGETCSLARGCDAGLYCRVDTRTRTGTCEPLSASCAASPSCECLKTEGCPGRDYRECSIIGDLASVVCE